MLVTRGLKFVWPRYNDIYIYVFVGNHTEMQHCVMQVLSYGLVT